MISGEAAPRDRLASWCGGWLAAVFVATPPIAWAAPLGFAPLLALAGLACLPAFRVRNRDRAAYLALIALAVWALGSTVWSPYRPPFEDSTALKLWAEVVLYFAAISAAQRASPSGLALVARILAWGMAGLGALMTAEALSGGAVYQALRNAMGDPIRPDLGIKNIAQSLFVLTLLLAPASLAAWRSLRQPWLIIPMIAGLILGCLIFGYDAPILALAVGVAVGGAVYFWPGVAPRVVAVLVGVYLLCAPIVVQALRASGLYAEAEADVPLSWSQRMGYWRHAADWIVIHPARGWGLDASRMFSPGIQLHPHNGALQIWLELGLVGVFAVAAFWVLVFLRLNRRERDPAVVVAAASCTAYLVFGSVSFGVWQEWWLGLGALTAIAVTVAARAPAKAAGELPAPVTRRSSTRAPISE
jgi:O-antigen ligase